MRARTLLPMILALCFGLALLISAGRIWRLLGGQMAHAQESVQNIRLRSFFPGASGDLAIVPGPSGGRLKLTVSGLPKPQSFDKQAQIFVAWAVAPGREINLGEVSTDSNGNGTLEFAAPPLEKYSLIVAAESSSNATTLMGAPVLSTRAGEVTSLFGKDSTEPNNSSAGHAVRRVSGKGFFGEIDAAIRDDAPRRLNLIGEDFARRARGEALVAEQAGETFVRGHLNRLPSPRTAGASQYVLWAVGPDGKAVYLGALPAGNIGSRLIYVRAPDVGLDHPGLMVTAETDPVPATPSGRVALRSVTGDPRRSLNRHSIRRARHRRRRRHRRRARPHRVVGE
jgi:hypothetical protein